MKNINKIKHINLLIILITSFCAGYSQNSVRSNIRQFTWVYELPSSYPRGPLDITVKGEYFFTKEKLGERYFVRLHCKMLSLEFNPVIYGTLRYKYNSKEYRQDQLDATDHQGSYGFDQIRIIKIAADIDVSFLENAKTVSIGDGISKEVGNIEKDADLNKLNLEFAGSKLTYLNWDGAYNLERRIQNLNKPKLNNTNNNSNTNNTLSPINASNNLNGNNSDQNFEKTPMNTVNGNSSSSNPEKRNQSSSNSIESVSRTNNTTNLNSSTNSQNTIINSLPSTESQMIKLGIDPNKDYLGELITMGGTLLQEINENRRLRWEKEIIEAERLEKVKAENAANNTKKYLNYFEENFVNKYYQIAKEGNDTARMLLLMKTKELIIECSEQPNSSYCKFSDFSAALPDNITYPNNIQSKWDWLRQSNWLKEMCENKNIDALLFIGSIIQNEYTILNLTLPKLELAASLGSLDAMVILGMYYNGNSKIYGGSSEEKALYWLTKAANAGCPMSAYYLGMIYRYKNILGDLPINYVRKNLAFIPYYSIKKDEKIAADWFAKSIAYSKNHNESSFAKHILICERAFWSRKLSWTSMKDSYYGMAASITNPDVYIQLAEMYSKGIGVSKNSELAEQLKLEGEALYDFYKNLK